jgi:hypothetical protein
MKSRILGIVFAAFCGSGIAVTPNPLSQTSHINFNNLKYHQQNAYLFQVCKSYIETLKRVYGSKLEDTIKVKTKDHLLLGLDSLYARLAPLAQMTGFTALELAKIADQEKASPEDIMMSRILWCDRRVAIDYNK